MENNYEIRNRNRIYCTNTMITYCVWLAQSCPTLCNPMNCSPSGSSVYGILQTSILEWVAISYSRGPSQPRDWTWVSCILADPLPSEPPGKMLLWLHFKNLLKSPKNTFKDDNDYIRKDGLGCCFVFKNVWWVYNFYTDFLLKKIYDSAKKGKTSLWPPTGRVMSKAWFLWF